MQRKVALVTGASRGIGRGISIELAKSGYDLVVNYARNQEAAQETKKTAESFGIRATTYQADVSKSGDRKNLVDHALSTFGRIDVLVNNAGVAPKERGVDMLNISEEDFDYVMQTNVNGPFFLTQRVAKEMIRLIKEGMIKEGKIFTISSISAYTSSINRAAYPISKAALSMVTAEYADRLASENIFVYEIRPGVIETDMTAGVKEKYQKLISEGLIPITRLGKPEDIGHIVALVARESIPYTTGQVFNVDGGFHIRRL